MKFKIRKSGEFKIKPTHCPHWHAMHELNYIGVDNKNGKKGGTIYSVKTFDMCVLHQIFWLWFIIEIDNAPKRQRHPFDVVTYEQNTSQNHKVYNE